MQCSLLATLAAAGFTALGMAATTDNNVEWDGVSHAPTYDRNPRMPVDQQTFEVSVQVFRFDVEQVSVIVEPAGGGTTSIPAAFLADRGPYAVWGASIPADAGARLEYYFELRDGTDTDYLGANGMSDTAPADGFVIDFNTLEHAPYGATPLANGGVVFRVWAPGVSSAMVRGGWNWGSGGSMSRLGDDFVVRVNNAVPGPRSSNLSNYKYVFNNSIWKPDPRSRALHPNDNYNSVIGDPNDHTWTSDGYQRPAFDDLIIYQMHVGTYPGRNHPLGPTANPAQYTDVYERIDHIIDLGVTAVQINPITEFPWDWSGGYNPISQFAVESAYGDPAELKLIIDELHKHDIAVFLDIVWNHISGSDNFLWFYTGQQVFFDNPAIETPWGSQMDYDRPEVRQYYLDSLMHWMEEYRIDGFRFDATDFINQYQGTGWGLMQSANDMVDNRYVDRFMIAEQLPTDPWVTRPTNLGGAGFDAQYHMQYRDTIRGAIFDSAFGSANMWNVAAALDGSGQYLNRTQVINYIELHDEAWTLSGGQRMVRTIDTTAPHDDIYARSRTKLGQGIGLVSPGVPAFLMGTEWLEDTNFGSSGPNPTNPEERLDWSKRDTYAGILEYYKDLIAVRKSNPALNASANIQTFLVNDGDDVLAFQRWNDQGNVIVVVVNFSDNNYTNYQIGAPQPGVWYELINSQSVAYDGEAAPNCGPLQTVGQAVSGFGQSLFIDIPRMSLLVLRHAEAPEDFLDIDGDGLIDACDDACLCGDVNGDGAVNAGDIDCFVQAVVSGVACDDCSLIAADANGDNAVNAGDIDMFVAAVVSGACP